jgi:hypothetical protein
MFVLPVMPSMVADTVVHPHAEAVTAPVDETPDPDHVTGLGE